MPLRILLADDHTLMRQGLRIILERHEDLEIVAEASSGQESIDAAQRFQPDVAIIDIGMKELNGIEATVEILKRSPRTHVLILSMYSDERYVVRAVNAGARGYVLKNSAGEELITAIRAVQQGKPFFSPVISKLIQDRSARIVDSPQLEDRYDLLTDRERQIYQMLAEGSNNKEIADRLGLSLHTVETHRARIMDKLSIHSAAELVLGAVRRGLVS